MIEKFKLDHEILELDRSKEIEAFFPTELIETLTQEDLEALAEAMEPPSKVPQVEFASIIRAIALNLLS